MGLDKAMQVARFGGESLKATYHRYERFLPAASFLAGTLWDVVTIGRIDQLANLIQLGIYLTLVGTILVLEILDAHRPFAVAGKLATVWRYRDQVTHFLLGSLLSAFTIFYFKSSSIIGSLAFFLVIAACLVGNEFSGLRRFGLIMRTVLFAVCLTSFLACVTPLWYGRIGLLPFMTAIAVAMAIGAGVYWLLKRQIADEEEDMLRRRVAGPFVATLAVFLLFYALRVIPPVPLAVTHIGIYHGVERVKGGYQVSWTRPAWKFWQYGDQSFAARPGEKIYCFFSVFSPGGFKDNVKVRWRFKHPDTGWENSDAVPVSISGGREGGFRGFAFKANYKPGDWQVRIETSDEREIGRINLTVELEDPGAELRPVSTEVL